MKELPISFEGGGEMLGFDFNQIRISQKAYIYELICKESGQKSYEVFERKENTRFDCVSYPRSNVFGKWAWCFVKYKRAVEKFDEINNKIKP
jgi:hypothetical protein